MRGARIDVLILDEIQEFIEDARSKAGVHGEVKEVDGTMYRFDASTFTGGGTIEPERCRELIDNLTRVADRGRWVRIPQRLSLADFTGNRAARRRQLAEARRAALRSRATTIR